MRINFYEQLLFKNRQKLYLHPSVLSHIKLTKYSLTHVFLLIIPTKTVVRIIYKTYPLRHTVKRIFY